MSVPKRFLVGLALGLALGVGSFVAFLYTQLGVPTENTQWAHDISRVKESYAAHISGQRLFVVAGSSALFGVNAQLIQQQTGCPTVNMGTHAALSLDYRFSRLKKVARPGDIVLLALEYESYTDRFPLHSDISDDYILARDPEYFHAMSFLSKIDMATRVPFARLQKGWKNWRSPPHQRAGNPSAYSPISPGIDCVDENGDEVYNMAAKRPTPPPAMYTPIEVLDKGLTTESTDGFRIISEFLLWARAHHLTVLATFPAVIDQPQYHEANAREAIQTITHFYATRHVPLIGTAEENMLPFDQFFDTVYHMTHEAALARTSRLIGELRPSLPVSK